jgi:tetratricopeptide (TPR) repeat protein
VGGTAEPRRIKVFVSSTFRDMQLEREELIKRVFPQIRRKCEERGVGWSEVDLRWGVTDEQKAEGAVLPICLAEIDRSRPYFIGLLGQRYGWVPDELPAELAEQMGWLTDAKDRSVTELEILHGVLNDPESAGHAFFYLRDPHWVDALPEAEREQYTEPEADGRQKLDELKERIRSSAHPVRTYADPVALGAQVLADLDALVDSVYPEEDAPDPLTGLANEHAAFAAARFNGYVPREPLEAALSTYAESPEVTSPLVVTGPAGAGATALVANWAARRRAEHPNDVVIEHYVGANDQASDWTALARRLIGELVRAHDLDGLDAEALPDDAAGLRIALARAIDLAAAAATADVRTVIVIDGVDQLDDVDGASQLVWLPATIPVGVRVVLTTLAGPPVEAARYRGWPLLEVPPLTETERRDLIEVFLARYAKALDVVHITRLATAEPTGNALYLRTVLSELRQHGDHFTLGALIEQLLAAPTPDDLLELVFTRYERDFERDRPGLVRDAFSALFAARKGLSEPELLDLLGTNGEPLPHAMWAPLFLAAEDGLVTAGGYLRFATDVHRQAVRDRYTPGPPAHAQLASYFRTQPLGTRVVDELPWHQLAAGDMDGLVGTISDLAFTNLAYRRSLPDLRRLWTRAEAAGRTMTDGYAPLIASPSVDPDAAWQVARLITDAGHLDAGIRMHRFLVEHARGQNTKALSSALVNLGSAQWLHGDLDGADASLAEAVDVERPAGNTPALRAALGNLAMVRRDRGDLAGANALFTDEEAQCRAASDQQGLQASLNNQAQLARQQGDTARAMACAEEMDRICHDLGDHVLIARADAVRATLLSDVGRIEEALPLYRSHADMCRDLGDLRGLTENLLDQATDLQRLGRMDEGTAAGTEAEQHARTVGDLTLLARVLAVRANNAIDGQRWAEAEALAREAELAARSDGAPAPRALALGALGMARREQGDNAGARAAHEEEERVALAMNDPGAVATARINLGAVDIVDGRFQDALARYAQAEEAYTKIGAQHALLPMLANRAQVRAHLGDHAAAVADYRKGAAIAHEAGLVAQEHQMLTSALELMYPLGQMAESEPLWQQLEAACRALGDDSGLQRALGERALIVLGRMDLDGAAPLLDEQEAICRRIGDQVALAACVGNRAILLRHRNDLEGSLRCIDEQLQLSNASGNAQGVLFATANRGEVLGVMGRKAEAIEALNQARTMATQWGVTAMVAQLDQLIAQFR